MKLYRKRGMDCSQKATSISLYLKSKVQNQGEEDGGYEHYLVFSEKIEESRKFDVFLCFLGEKYDEKKKKKNAQKDAQAAPKTSPFQSELPRAFYRPWHAFRGPMHLVGVLAALVSVPGWAPANINNFVLMHFFSFDFRCTFGDIPELILR